MLYQNHHPTWPSSSSFILNLQMSIYKTPSKQLHFPLHYHPLSTVTNITSQFIKLARNNLTTLIWTSRVSEVPVIGWYVSSFLESPLPKFTNETGWWDPKLTDTRHVWLRYLTSTAIYNANRETVKKTISTMLRKRPTNQNTDMFGTIGCALIPYRYISIQSVQCVNFCLCP